MAPGTTSQQSYQPQRLKEFQFQEKRPVIKVAKPVIFIQRPYHHQLPPPEPKPYTTTPPLLNVAEYEQLQRPTLQTVPTQSTNNLGALLKKLQDSNALPQTLTPANIDNSIKTLVHILSSIKKPATLSRPIVVPDEEDYEEADNEAGVGLGGSQGLSQDYPVDTPEGGTPGRPGVDYPALSSIPHTNFNCKTQRYKGFFADPDTHCQVSRSTVVFCFDVDSALLTSSSHIINRERRSRATQNPNCINYCISIIPRYGTTVI